jgi:hypothetical protein
MGRLVCAAMALWLGAVGSCRAVQVTPSGDPMADYLMGVEDRLRFQVRRSHD